MEIMQYENPLQEWVEVRPWHISKFIVSGHRPYWK